MSKVRALPNIADEINAAHAKVEQSFRDGVAHAIRAGELLIEAKHQHGKHGRWTTWLADNVHFSARTARAYMQLARLPPANRQRVADLPLREALSAIHCRERRLTARMITASRRSDPAVLMFQNTGGDWISVPAPGLVVAPEHQHLLLTARGPAPPSRPPPTRKQIADDLIEQLAWAFYEARDAISVDDLRAAFERRFPAVETTPGIPMAENEQK